MRKDKVEKCRSFKTLHYHVAKQANINVAIELIFLHERNYLYVNNYRNALNLKLYLF